MSNTAWIEPPPQRGMGCFAKGCLILVVFVIVLVIAFVGGSYLAIRYLRSEYFATTHVQLSTSMATEQEQETVRARWDAFEKAAHAGEPARIELTADDLNALIDSEPKLRGKAHVSIDNDVGHLQVSIPLADVRWLRGHYINAECTVQSAAGGSPADARITRIVVNGRSVGEEVLRWQYRSWSLRGYMSDWSNNNNLERFEIEDGKVVLQTKEGR
ncbi:MAG: hypothetical protein DMF34_10160 [Verrucomicrobia bacterium]|nr:MAG: hypothetical protein DMF34_10160 [Verrucomicrobiota bacterium]